MFEVSWSDPASETVGQRRSRRGHDQPTTAAPGIARASSTSTSTSTSTSSSSITEKKHRPKFLTLLNSTKKDFTRPSSRAKSLAQDGEVVREAVREVVDNRIRVDRVADNTSLVQELPPGTFASYILEDGAAITELPSKNGRIYIAPDEPTFVTWASRSASTDSTGSSMIDSPHRGSYMQPLSPTSFVTQRTEVTVSSREDVNESDQNGIVVHISSDGMAPDVTIDMAPQLSPSPTASGFHLPVVNDRENRANLSWLEDALSRPSSVCNIGDVAQNRWKAPDNWGSPLIPTPPPKSSLRPHWRPTTNEDKEPAPHGSVEKSLRRMRTASPKIMLERLTEEWTDLEDASFRDEVKFEKQLWMRTALHACIQMSMTEVEVESLRTARPRSPNAIKILSLFQDHASISHLSTLQTSASVEINHLTTHPASPQALTLTLTVPSPTASLPYGPALFTSLHASLSLPSQLPSSALPTLLRECHRVLHRGGTLHVTLIDPYPEPATTGPKMRSWLDAHLRLELERRFRCASPARLVPGWCADAGFDVAGGSAVHVRFAASVAGPLGGSRSRSRGWDADGEDEIRDELRAVVGRELWEECWGRFCVGSRNTAASRWWEDRGVMEECGRLGTTWEILVLKVEKGG